MQLQSEKSLRNMIKYAQELTILANLLDIPLYQQVIFGVLDLLFLGS
jgi:hypothetical protein